MGRARQIASAENMDRILLDASAASTDEGEHLLLDASAVNTDVGFFINTEVGTTETPPEGFVNESSLASNAVTNSKIASDAVTVTELDSSAQTLSNRNLVINGGMKVMQRSSGAITLGNDAFTYTLDRMGFYKSNAGTQTVEQDTDAPVGFDNSLLVKNTSADSSIAAADRLAFIYRVEGLDAAKLEFGTANAKTITISWYVKSTITGTFGGAVGNGSDNRAYPFLYTINSTDWERKSVTIPGDTEGTWATTSARSLQVALGLGVGSNNSGTAGAWESADRNSATGATTDWLTTVDSQWALTGLQIEIGSEATEFEQEFYSVTYEKSRRYYQQTSSNVQSSGFTYDNHPMCTYRFPVTMRAAPTVALISGAYPDGNSSDNGGFSQRTGTGAIGYSNPTGASFNTGTEYFRFFYSGGSFNVAPTEYGQGLMGNIAASMDAEL